MLFLFLESLSGVITSPTIKDKIIVFELIKDIITILYGSSLQIYIVYLAIILIITIYLPSLLNKIGISIYNMFNLIRRFNKLLNIPLEFERNCGTSLRDKIDSIHKDVLIQGNLLTGKVNTIMDYLGEAICEVDNRGHLIHATNQFYNLIGAKNYDEISGFNWLNFVKQDERGTVWDEFQDAIEQKRECTLNYTLLNGMKIIDKSTIIKDGNGNILRYIKRIVPVESNSTIKS